MTLLHVAVVMTCHERVSRTLACLRSLHDQTVLDAIHLTVSLVDADSTDGTADAVASAFPAVRVLRRSSDLFWNSGMREALADAHEHDPAHYLWLNDDVELDADALERLLASDLRARRQGRPPRVTVASTRDPTTGALTYGGVVRPHRTRPLHYELVSPDPREEVRVETMNGNCVLVPREVFALVGNLAAAYTHGMGDYDYGHRVERAGGEVWLAPGTFGTCARNPRPRPAASLAEHRARTTGVTTGLPRSEWFTFARRWAGPAWPVFAVSPYVRRWWRWAIRTRR
jgi:GT2 family glycosyltransferase